MSDKNIIEMIQGWKNELAEIKEDLLAKGGDAGSLEYNVLSSEALRLSMCITDATELLINE